MNAQLYDLIVAVVQSAAFRGAVAGVLTATAVDVQAFRTWKSFDDAARYEWKTAAWRFVQGAIIGGLAGLGLG